MRILYAAVSASLLFACERHQLAATSPTPKGAAEKGLRDFQGHMSDTAVKVLGFHDASEGARSRLGEPISVVEPICDSVLSVKDTAREMDPRTQSPREMFYYPILGDADRKASLILVSKLKADNRFGKAGEWITSQVGAKVLMGKLDTVLGSYPKEKAPSRFVLQLNALGLAFLGYVDGNDVRLIPASLTDSAKACLGPLASPTGSRAASVFAALSRCYDRKEVCAEVNMDSVIAHAKKDNIPRLKMDSTERAMMDIKRPSHYSKGN